MELSIEEKICILRSRIERNKLYLEFDSISQSVEYCSERENLIKKYKEDISADKNELRCIIIENFIEN